MLKSFRFHHIGFATDNIDDARSFLVKLGYIPGEEIYVPSQKVRVCFMNRIDQPQIELITSEGTDSPVDTILRKCGPGPYHLCYSVPDLNAAVVDLKKEKFILLNRPSKSNAIDNNTIIFAYKKNYGLIEIVEIPET